MCENGLIGMGRDIIIKLACLLNENLIGIGNEIYAWQKQRLWQLMIFGQKRFDVIFGPNPPYDGTIYSSSCSLSGSVIWKFALKNKTVSISFNLPLHLARIFLLDVVVGEYLGVGVALKSLFPFLTVMFLTSREGTCAALATGIYMEGGINNNVTGHFSHLWDAEAGVGVPVCLELNAIAHTLHFVVNGKLVPLCVTHVPVDVCFAATKVDVGRMGVKVLSLRTVSTSVADSAVTCKQQHWR